ncbi:hypothetical protein [Fodinibius saliphilus]|uniref:hypothetical protein n=1 Tax=Fodinibius saliphilus TaxID=1920650 RepID=UPI001107C511|nr:hypothetical protein [Fodinibius saliphilus]
MATPITLKEHSYKLWKIGTVISAILSIVLFLVFWNITDPFWGSIFRLLAFIFFALTVLGYLKLMNGPLQVRLDNTEELLVVSYRKKDTIIQEEQFEIDTINQITSAAPSENPLIAYIQPKTVVFKINFSDTQRELFLFEFSGRPLLFEATDQKKIKDFLQSVEIDESIPL